MIIQSKINFGSGFVIVNPRNEKDFEFTGVWAFYSESGSLDSIHPSVTLKEIDGEFTGEDAAQLWDYRNAGITGGPGIGVALPYNIYDAQNPTLLVWQGMLDLGDARVTWEQDRVVAPIKPVITLEWFYKTCEAIDFALLRQYTIPAAFNGQQTLDGRTMKTGQYLFGPPTGINQPGAGALYQYKMTAYTITYTPELLHDINLLFHWLGFISKLGEAIKSTIKDINDISGAYINELTVLYTVPFTIVVIADIITVAYDILNDIILMAEMVGNIELTLNQLGIIDKFKYDMLVTDIIYGVLTYINQQNGGANLTFSSSILGVGRNGVGYGGAYATIPPKPPTNYDGWYPTQGLTAMPRKNIIVNQSWQPSIQNFINGLEHPRGDETKPGTLGPPYGTPDGNVKKFFLDICVAPNATFKLLQGTTNDLQFEEIHYWDSPVNFTIPNEGAAGYNANYPDPDKLNLHELSNNYELMFELDGKDGMTDARYNGTTCSIATYPKTGGVIYWSNPNGKLVKIPFALAKTKQWGNLGDQIMGLIIELIKTPFEVLAKLYNGFASALTWLNGFLSNGTVVSDIIDILMPGFYLEIHAVTALLSNNTGNIALITSNFSWNFPNYPFLELTEDTTGVPKLFMGYNAMQPPGLSFESTGSNQHPFYKTAGKKTGPNAGTGWNGVGWQPRNNDSPYVDLNGDRNYPNESYVSADVLMRLFHSKNLITPPLPPYNVSNPLGTGYDGGNQWVIYENKRFKLSVADFMNILQNGNVINWIDGSTPCFLEKLTWKPADDMAIEVTYRIKKTWTINLLPPIITIDGTA